MASGAFTAVRAIVATAMMAALASARNATGTLRGPGKNAHT